VGAAFPGFVAVERQNFTNSTLRLLARLSGVPFVSIGT